MTQRWVLISGTYLAIDPVSSILAKCASRIL